jgi:hypothetical protein
VIIKKEREKFSARSGIERMIQDRMFQLMRLRLILERISIYVFSLRRREYSILIIGVSLRRRRRQDGTDHIIVEVIDRLRRVHVVGSPSLVKRLFSGSFPGLPTIAHTSTNRQHTHAQ